MLKFVCSFILISFYSFLIAQPIKLSFEALSFEEGVPLFRGLIQDSEGFLWFGTLNGVYRYDGYTYKPYIYDPLKKTTMTIGYVNTIYEDRNKNFWLGTSSGLNRLDRNTGDFEQYVPDSSSHVFKRYIWSVLEDSRGTLWVGAMGLYRMNDSTGRLDHVVFPKGLEILNRISFQSISEDKNGIIWFGTTIGLFKFDRNSNSFIPVLIDPDASKLGSRNWNTGNYSMPAMYKDNSGCIWIGTYGSKVIKLNPDTGLITEFLLQDEKGVLCPVQSIAEENNDQLWLGTYNGLILFNKLSGKILQHFKYDENTSPGLTDEKILSILKDKSGTLWAASLNGGLNRVNRTTLPFKNIYNKNWMKDKAVTLAPYQDFFVSRTGPLFIGTAYGIEEMNPVTGKTTVHPPIKGINVMMEDSKGNHWIGLKQAFGGGLFKRDLSGKLYQVTDSTGKHYTKEVHCFFNSQEGKVYFGAEFNVFEVNEKENSAGVIFRTQSRIHSLGEDNEGNLLVGTLLGGLYVLSPSENYNNILHFLNNKNDPYSIIEDNSVIGMYNDKKKRTWLFSTLGFCQYEPGTGKFKRYNKSHGLATNVILCATADDSGRLWFGTVSGISSFNPETGLIRNYDKSYGTVEGYHYSTGHANGKIYFKGRAGITYFNPEDIKDNPFIPPIKITEFKIFDKTYPVNDEITLGYDENYISFEFAALSYVSPEKNKYAYILEGMDKDWVYPKGRRYAAYTGLKPGEYTFRVKASNNDGVWNEEGTSLSIIILPPWWQTWWAYSFYLLTLVLIVYAWRRYDLKRQDLKYQLKVEHAYAEKQEEISRMKSRFFTNISHEFRTPLTLIIGPADRITSATDDMEIHKQTGLIRKNALHLLRLISQLLDISKFDEGKLNLQVTKNDIAGFARGILMIFESLALDRQITLTFDAGKDNIDVYFDKTKMENILINLISNAFKFTPEGGQITVSILDTESRVFIKVRDTGVGIPSAELNKLFDRFYQVDSSQTRKYGGTGIGLALTKELVDLHHGKISAASKEGEWTEFTVELQLGKDHFSKDQLADTETASEVDTDIRNRLLKEQMSTELAAAAVGSGQTVFPDDDSFPDSLEEKTIILVVEDNADVRKYIKDSLGEEYEIIEASNGDEGVTKAEKVIPDLIISDIMMPKMDGFELTKILKNNDKTDHIPIILLTAKSDQQSRFSGLERGADDYLIKPFDTEELKLRVCNLINLRKKLQRRYSGGEKAVIEHDEVKSSKVNEKFMVRINDIISRHMAEEDFSIEDFSSEMAMGRTQLHRKFKAITGKSPSRFIRTYRLNAARKMMADQQGNISEIAYSVGFSSPIYFSKCFKEEFGCTPTEFILQTD
jgi:signal transduction histidine kinase/ligand-binding sensor domain-containing protein/DNA-binding response OmpR family regulator